MPIDALFEHVLQAPFASAATVAKAFDAVAAAPADVSRKSLLNQLLKLDEAALGDAYAGLRATNARQWQTVFEEDRGVVEGMQAGRASPAFQGGVFSPVMDGPTHNFHHWVATQLSATRAV